MKIQIINYVYQRMRYIPFLLVPKNINKKVNLTGWEIATNYWHKCKRYFIK